MERAELTERECFGALFIWHVLDSQFPESKITDQALLFLNMLYNFVYGRNAQPQDAKNDEITKQLLSVCDALDSPNREKIPDHLIVCLVPGVVRSRYPVS